MVKGEKFRQLEEKYKNGELGEYANGFFSEAKKWKKIVEHDWEGMVKRCRDRNGSDAVPEGFSWKNKGSITTAFWKMCGAAKSWHENGGHRIDGTTVSESSWFGGVLEYAQGLARKTQGTMTMSKLKMKYDDWRHGGAYWNRSTATATADAVFVSEADDAAPAAKRQKVDSADEPPPPPPDPRSYRHGENSRQQYRHKLYNKLVDAAERDVPFNAELPAQLSLPSTRAPPAQGLRVPSAEPPRQGGAVQAVLLKANPLRTEVAPRMKIQARQWLAEAANARCTPPKYVVSELLSLSIPLDPQTLQEAVAHHPPTPPPPPSPQEGEENLPDDASVASSEPYTEGYWDKEDIAEEHPVRGVIGMAFDTLPQGPAGKAAAPPASWNAYLIATALEEAAFDALQGKTDSYHQLLRAVALQLGSKASTLRSHLLRHLVAPEQVVRLTPLMLAAKFRKPGASSSQALTLGNN